MTPNPPEDTQVSVEDVQAFLASRSQGAVEKPQTGEENTFPVELPKEVLDMASQAGQPAAPDRIHLPVKPSGDPELPVDHPWQSTTPGLENLKVLDYEKDVFIKCAVHDEAVELDIELPKRRITVRVRSLSAFEEDVVYRAIHLDAVDDGGLGLNQINNKLQHYVMALQIVHVVGAEDKILGIRFPDPALVDIVSAANILRSHYRRNLASLSAPRFQTFVRAIHVFEEKMRLCNEALINEDFS